MCVLGGFVCAAAPASSKNSLIVEFTEAEAAAAAAAAVSPILKDRETHL